MVKGRVTHLKILISTFLTVQACVSVRTHTVLKMALGIFLPSLKMVQRKKQTVSSTQGSVSLSILQFLQFCDRDGSLLNLFTSP